MQEVPWTWTLNQDRGNGLVDATIHSTDNKTQLKVTSVPGQLVDNITALLTSSYQWGASEVPQVASFDSSDIESLKKEIEELKQAKIRDAQTIGGLKGNITKLKTKYGEE